jgi:hypothetical protein
MPSFQYGGGILTTRSLEHNDERNRPVSKPVVVTGGSGKLGKCELGFRNRIQPGVLGIQLTYPALK